MNPRRRYRLTGLAVIVAAGVTAACSIGSASHVPVLAITTAADAPAVQPGADVLAGVTVVPQRRHRYDYRRAAFGDAWTDDNDAPGGHNGCDTRDDILNRDLVDKTYVSVKRCPDAVATGTLHDPYTNDTIAFVRGPRTGEAVQIDHIVPLSYAWDEGAWNWTPAMRVRFANDPANLLAVQGQANQDKGDKAPALWMPPNAMFHCRYALKFAAVLRGYGLPVDAPSVPVLRGAVQHCPAGW